MAHQDWTPVTITKGRRAAGESAADAVARAARTLWRRCGGRRELATNARHLAVFSSSCSSGGLVSEKRFDAGASATARKLEEDTDHFVHATVDRTLAQAIQHARLAKKMTQKDLAAAIAEKPSVIGDYEAGRAIPVPGLIVKMERALDARLPRPAKKK